MATADVAVILHLHNSDLLGHLATDIKLRTARPGGGALCGYIKI